MCLLRKGDPLTVELLDGLPDGHAGVDVAQVLFASCEVELDRLFLVLGLRGESPDVSVSTLRRVEEE